MVVVVLINHLNLCSLEQRERDYAAEQCARVIDAYRTLADPLSRAIYTVGFVSVFFQLHRV